MKLNLKKPIIFFDLETTGVNVSVDRIVEICYIKVMPNGNELSRNMRINPGMPIPKEASDVHGITNEDVKDCPTFKEVARDIAKDFEGCDIAGFNSNRFDVPMLAEEFLRAGVDIDACTQEFFGKHGYIETVRIESGDVASFEVLGDVACNLLEGGAVLYILVGDAMHVRRLFGDGHSGVNAHVARELVAVGHDLYVAYFHYAIDRHVYACRFEVEEYDRFFKI